MVHGEPVIRTVDLTKRYGSTVALDAFDLSVPAGIVFGCLGPNGAGKTTLLRLLVGLLRPTRGRAEVFGVEPRRDAGAVRARVGYLPGDFTAYRELSGAQYLRYLAGLRARTRRELVERRAAQLAERLELDLSRRVGSLSHGNRQKVGIVQAFMHDPDLLVLDEPTTGLDPFMQREFLAMVHEARDAGRTVVLSSHILNEVEAVADLVGIVHQGRLAVVDTVATLKARASRRIDLTFAGDPPVDALGAVTGVSVLGVDDSVVHLVVEGSTADLVAALGSHRVDDIMTHEADLEEVFLAHSRPGGTGHVATVGDG